MHDKQFPRRRNTNSKQAADVSLQSDTNKRNSEQSESTNDQKTPLSTSASEKPVDILSYMAFKL